MSQPSWKILEGDCRDVLPELPEESVHTVVTSPPYFGLRDYGTADWEGGDPDCEHYQGRPGAGRADGKVDDRGQRNRDGAAALTSGVCSGCGAVRVDQQIGLEPTPGEFVEAMVKVFREVRRVLRDDGTVWLNLGDSLGAGKQLLGIPWRVAFALQDDGWILRSDVIWAKPNPMPESVTDRPTKAHEYVFLLTKNARYFYDADAIREPLITKSNVRDKRGEDYGHLARLSPEGAGIREWNNPAGRNKRSVWTVATQPYADAHFATYSPALIEPCVLAGCPEGGTVLDPFSGAGTTGLVAVRNRRGYVGIELNPEYAEMSRKRIETDLRIGHRPPQRGPEVHEDQETLL